MRRPGRFLVVCLLLVLLPLRSLLAAGQLECESAADASAHTMPAAMHHMVMSGDLAGHAPYAHDASHAATGHAGHVMTADTGHAKATQADAGQGCKLCAPCCLAAAPPPMLVLDAALPPLATQALPAPVQHWAAHVPALPDPPPRG